MKKDRRIPGHIVVVAACACAGGAPTFAVTAVKATEDEIENGEHYDAAEERLSDQAYESPFVFFDEDECPDWLMQNALRLNGVKDIRELLKEDEDGDEDDGE